MDFLNEIRSSIENSHALDYLSALLGWKAQRNLVAASKMFEKYLQEHYGRLQVSPAMPNPARPCGVRSYLKFDGI